MMYSKTQDEMKKSANETGSSADEKENVPVETADESKAIVDIAANEPDLSIDEEEQSVTEELETSDSKIDNVQDEDVLVESDSETTVSESAPVEIADESKATEEVVANEEEQSVIEKIEKIETIDSTIDNVKVDEVSIESDSETTVSEPESLANEEESTVVESDLDSKTTEEVVAKEAEEVESKSADIENSDNEDVDKDEVEAEKQDVAAASKTDESEVDFTKLSEIELINALKDLLDNKDFTEVHAKVDAIKICFYKKHKASVQEQKKSFLADGGYEEEFTAEANPYEDDLKNLMAVYRQKKFQYGKLFEAEKDENLKRKYEIIDEIKDLVNRKESINKTFQEFNDLQQSWREVGIVPQANMKDLWENYHHHVENFYDYIKINQELRDLDLKKNLEEKIGLCEKAEKLLIEPSVIKAFNSLQKLHDTWREIGPAPRDKKEEIWERFKDATTAINKKHQDFFENRKKSQKKNYDAKTALCEKVEELNASEMTSHKEWETKSKEIIELQKYWRTIGFAPKKDNTQIYERFRVACDTFFDQKREFYNKHKEIQSNNLQLKIDLCIQAEGLKDNTDWKKTTEEFISIQKKWKDVGPVPRKHSDIVWKRFRSACDHFFNQKSKFFSSIDETQVENLRLKEELIVEVANFKPTGKDNADLDVLRGFQRRWTEVGHVPIANKNDVQKRFRDAVNLQFDNMRVEDRDRNLLRFKSKVSDWKDSSRGQNKSYAERDKHVAKLRQLESDLITLKNNIGFFANSKNAEVLIKDVERKIQNNEEQIVYLKDKIKIIDQLDNGNE